MPWKKSTRSGGNGCVEVNLDAPAVGVRDSKDPNSPVVTFAPQSWREFISDITAGRYDLPRD
jgi:hypothetical protein